MYCDYWNLKKAPFDNVPDPEMYVPCHPSLENAICEILFAIREADESLAVIVSEAGLGKTLALRKIINTLAPDRFRSVLITNPSLSFTQLLREIIIQITGRPCEEVQKGVLMDLLKNQLTSSMAQGKKIVIFIDEANALTPSNLEDLRLLTNIQDEKQNLLTLVIAGQLELAQRLEHPQQANLYQRIGAYARIEKLPSIEAVKQYVEERLRLAGTNIKIFEDDCFALIWNASDYGVPRLINKICKLSLKTGETNQSDYISADIVAWAAGRFRKITDTAAGQVPSINLSPVRREQDFHSISEAKQFETQANVKENEDLSNEMADGSVHPSDDVSNWHLDAGKTSGRLIQFPLAATNDVSDARNERDILDPKKESSETTVDQTKDIELFQQWEEAISQPPDTSFTSAMMENMTSTIHGDSSPLAQTSSEKADVISEPEIFSPQAMTPPHGPSNDAGVEPPTPFSPLTPQQDTDNDIIHIGGHRVKLGIPKDILKQVKSFNRESANKSAGFWAAQIMKNNPELTRSFQADPVHLWNEIKENILKKIAV